MYGEVWVRRKVFAKWKRISLCYGILIINCSFSKGSWCPRNEDRSRLYYANYLDVFRKLWCCCYLILYLRTESSFRVFVCNQYRYTIWIMQHDTYAYGNDVVQVQRVVWVAYYKYKIKHDHILRKTTYARRNEIAWENSFVRLELCAMKTNIRNSE